jgi:hypothetical protein
MTDIADERLLEVTHEKSLSYDASDQSLANSWRNQAVPTKLLKRPQRTVKMPYKAIT